MSSLLVNKAKERNFLIMSGILDKKSRIIDFVITENGREQMEDGDIRYKFASFSDKSIIYTKNHDLSLVNKSNITDSELHYIPLEVATKLNDNINPEFDIRKFYTDSGTSITGLNDVSIDTQGNDFLMESSLSGYLKNLKLLRTKNIVNEDAELSFIERNTNNEEIDFSDNGESSNNSNVLKYSTIKKRIVKKKNIPVIALDKRFSHKTNFLYLPPTDSVTGVNLYSRDNFKNLEDLDEENSTGFLLSSYNQLVDESSIESREKEILKILRSIKSNDSLYKRLYEIEKPSENDSLIFEMHELHTVREADLNADPVIQKKVNLKKLHFVKIGDFYDKPSGTTKKVYLIGKFFNTRDNSDDLDTMFTFNDGKVNLDSKSTFTLSAYFSFVSLFTLVVE